MTDREKYLTILDRFYRGRGGSLLTKDESEALDYAISSIKTDLKYDLLYEETNHIANVSKMIEPITKNDVPENNVGKIDSTTKNDLGVDYTINGLDDFIKFGKKAFGVELTIKKSDNPDTYAKLFGTTKNDLADGKDNNVTSTDCISREEAIDTIRQLYLDLASQKAVIDILKVLPSVTPQISSELEKNSKKLEKNFGELDCISRKAVFEAIDDCNSDGLKGIFCSYDDGERFKEYIKNLPSVTPQERKGHWIVTAEEYYKAINEKGGGVNENTPYFTDDIACPECLAKFSVIDNETERFDYCPNCGADLKEETE